MRGTKQRSSSDVADEPQHDRERQPGVGGGEQDQRAGAVDQDVPDAGEQRDEVSRIAGPVCITRLAMRPAKSFWKNAQDCRTTCQWFCQRMRFDTLAAIAWLASRFCGEHRQRPRDQQHQRHRRRACGQYRANSVSGAFGRDQA